MLTPKERKILIVDDEPLILSSLSKALCSVCGFQGEVKTVGNGTDALKEIDNCFYSICFLDIHLPDTSGLDIMRNIKDRSPDTKIAIMTASFLDDEMLSIIESGASVLLAKPVNLSEVSFFVKRVLNSSTEAPAKEQRMFERIHCRDEITYFVSVSDTKELRAEAVDISGTGIGIVTDYPLQYSDILWFKRGLENKAGVVKWSMKLQNNYRAGIEFM